MHDAPGLLISKMCDSASNVTPRIASAGPLGAQYIVYIVDDDPAICATIRALCEIDCLPTETFGTAEAFLEAYDPGRIACLVLDVGLPGINGLDLMEDLSGVGRTLSVIMMSGDATTSTVVRAIRAGAIDFLDKPLDLNVLRDRIWQLLFIAAQQRSETAQAAARNNRVGGLTPREAQVMELVVAGMTTRQAAAALAISPKTVEVHRRHIMKKTRTKSAVELVRLAVGLSTEPGPDVTSGRGSRGEMAEDRLSKAGFP